jgi:polyphosphate glucokinase
MQSLEQKLTLAVDVGGSGIKAIVLDAKGKPTTSRDRLETPKPAKPEAVILVIAELAAKQGEFDRVSLGFPGVVRDGVTKGAINLDPAWDNFDLQTVLTEKLGKPVRIANDADVQGLGAISGKGVELVVTLGTGFGSSIFIEGKLLPNLEMGQHNFRSSDTYEQRLGQAALDKVGEKMWNQQLAKAIASLYKLFNYDCLYIGGGNAKKVAIELPENVKIVSNKLGLLGGIALWKEEM